MVIDEFEKQTEEGKLIIRELRKKKILSEKAKSYIGDLENLSVEDWILLTFYANNKPILKTKLFKEIFLISERLGFNNNIFQWRPYHFGPYSDKVEEDIKKLASEKIIDKREGSSKSKNYYIYELKDTKKIKKLWEWLPSVIKDTIKETVEEFKDKKSNEVKDYVHITYPKYAVEAI